ncbi:hypothetical protein [Pontivivens ytuae]|uniref:Uncharacterized protein n=1 Tax=Pontivivens ytuae TaxID=2789856 RepID=A0A7S9QDF1_9RHOB|nr:hypothetical protein [Pontivivens ytuae]QPH54322.1 hypothetical protein I0K15_00650 [Pontivivens ytuae]
MNIKWVLVLLASGGAAHGFIAANGNVPLANAVALNWILGGLALLLFWYHIAAGAAALALFLSVFVYPPIADRLILRDQLAAVAAIEILGEPIDLSGKTILFLAEEDVAHGGCYFACDALVMTDTPDAVYLLAAGVVPGLRRQFESGIVDLRAVPARQVIMEDPTLPRARRRGRPPTPEEALQMQPWVTDSVADLSSVQIDYVAVAGFNPAGSDLADMVNGELTEDERGYMPVRYHTRVYAPTDLATFDINGDEPVFSVLTMERRVAAIPYNPFSRYSYTFEHRFRRHYDVSRQALETGRFLCGQPDRADVDNCVTKFHVDRWRSVGSEQELVETWQSQK